MKELGKISFILTSAVLICSCGKKDKSSTSSTSPTATTSAASLLAGMSKIASAFTSASNLTASTSLAFAEDSLNLSGFSWQNYPTECNAQKSGWPVTDDLNAGGSGGSFDYNVKFVNCLLKEPDISGETILGAIMNVAGLACSIGDKLVFDGAEHELSLEVSESCYAPAYVDFFKNELGVSSISGKFVASKSNLQGNTTGQWSGSVRMKFSLSAEGKTATMDRIVLFREGSGLFDMFVVDGGDSAGMLKPWENAFSASLDTKNGVVRYEYRRPKSVVDDGVTWGMRHGRVMIQGALSDAGAFSAVENLEMIYANFWNNPSQTALPNGFAAIKTAKGSTSNGFYLNTFETRHDAGSLDPFTIASVEKPLSGCFPAGKTCVGNAGILFAADADLAFLLPPATATGNEKWFQEAVPLSFNAVSTSEK